MPALYGTVYVRHFKILLEQCSEQELSPVIRLLNAKEVPAAEIHRQLVEVHGNNVMTRTTSGKMAYAISKRSSDNQWR